MVEAVTVAAVREEDGMEEVAMAEVAMAGLEMVVAEMEEEEMVVGEMGGAASSLLLPATTTLFRCFAHRFKFSLLTV